LHLGNRCSCSSAILLFAGFLDKGKKQAGSKSGYSNLGTGQREEGPAAAARAREQQQQQQHPYGRSKGSAAGMAGMTPDESAAFLHPGGAAAGSSSAAAAGQPSRKVGMAAGCCCAGSCWRLNVMGCCRVLQLGF
jgi:hypothetical protein